MKHPAITEACRDANGALKIPKLDKSKGILKTSNRSIIREKSFSLNQTFIEDDFHFKGKVSHHPEKDRRF